MPIPSEVAERVDAGDAQGALERLESHGGALGSDRELTLAWLELLEATPSHGHLVDVAQRALQGFPSEPRVVIAACAALVARAQLRSPDEPPLAEGAAALAATAAGRCIETLSDAQASDPDIAGYLWINRANALRHAGAQNDADALTAYDRALTLAPDRGHWWFDLGVLHKWRGRYEQAFDCTLKARARVGATKPVLWNLAIAATALGQGDVAAGAWRDLGIPAEVNPKSGMPYVEGLPPAQIRVPSRGPGTGAPGDEVPDRAVGLEVLWVAPLSPCHGVVQTPPFREAPVDFGDVVLWDGSPVGIADDGTPRFPLLTRLRAGDEHRWRFVALEQQPGDARRVADGLPEPVRVFVQRERVEWMCPQCASGDAFRKHDHLPTEEHRIVYGTMVAPPTLDLAAFRATYEGLLREGGKVAIALPGLYEALGDTKKAGQQHQAWRGIERTADKRGLAS
jgi:hypothetical protein